MRIAHLGPATLPTRHASGGAIQRRIVELARAQVYAGDDVLVISLPGTNDAPEDRGVRYQSVKCRTRRPLRDLEYLSKSLPILGRFKPEVVHFHGLPFGAFLTDSVKAVKVLTFDFFEFRGSRNPAGRVVYRHCLQRFDRLVAVSEYCRHAFSAYWSLAQDKIDVVYNGVNIDQFRPDPRKGADMRRRLGVEGRRVLLYVGRVCEQKGTDLLLDAWVNVRQRFSDTELVVVGPPNQFGFAQSTSLLARIRKEGGRYLGVIDDHGLADVYNACDIFIMPTRWAEMFGMAAVEAQACGKPVVASRIGGLTEALSSDSALFFAPNDAVGLSDAILHLLGDRELASSLAAQAVTWASRFAWRSIADRTRSVYETAVAGR